MCTIIIAGDRKLKSLLAEEEGGRTDKRTDDQSRQGADKEGEPNKSHTETQTERTGSCGKGKIFMGNELSSDESGKKENAKAKKKDKQSETTTVDVDVHQQQQHQRQQQQQHRDQPRNDQPHSEHQQPQEQREQQHSQQIKQRLDAHQDQPPPEQTKQQRDVHQDQPRPKQTKQHLDLPEDLPIYQVVAKRDRKKQTPEQFHQHVEKQLEQHLQQVASAYLEVSPQSSEEQQRREQQQQQQPELTHHLENPTASDADFSVPSTPPSAPPRRRRADEEMDEWTIVKRVDESRQEGEEEEEKERRNDTCEPELTLPKEEHDLAVANSLATLPVTYQPDTPEPQKKGCCGSFGEYNGCSNGSSWDVDSDDAHFKPPTYLPFSIFTTFFCNAFGCCLGILALFFSLQAEADWRNGEVKSARKKGKVALRVGFAAFAIGLVAIAILVILFSTGLIREWVRSSYLHEWTNNNNNNENAYFNGKATSPFDFNHFVGAGR